jgi:hypothetical protein
VQLGFGGLGMAAAAAVRGRVRIPLLRGRWQELASARGCTVRGAPGAARTASTRNRTRNELLVSAIVEIVRRRRRPGGGAR